MTKVLSEAIKYKLHESAAFFMLKYKGSKFEAISKDGISIAA